MRNRVLVLLVLAGMAGTALTGCDRQRALPDPSVSLEANELVKSQLASKPIPLDEASEQELKAGLDATRPLIIATQDGYAKVEPKNKNRFFMHPDADKIASIEFDTSSLTGLSLSPRMEDFSSVQDCAGNPQAGVVRVRWSVDAAAPKELIVDRAYTGRVDIDLNNASRLKVEVDNGNGVPWCDWFSLGIVDVRKSSGR